MIERQFVRLLHFRERDIGLHLGDAGQGEQFLHHQVGEGREVGRDDAQHVVGLAGDGEAFQHFGQGGDLPFEFGGPGLVVAFEDDLRVGRYAEAEGGRIEQGGVAGDDLRVFQPLDAAADLRGGEAGLLAEFGVGGVAVALQRGEELQVVAVDAEFAHGFLARCTKRA